MSRYLLADPSRTFFIFITFGCAASLIFLLGSSIYWQLSGVLAFSISCYASYSLLRRIQHLGRRVVRQKDLLIQQRISQRNLDFAIQNGSSRIWDWSVIDPSIILPNIWKSSWDKPQTTIQKETKTDWLLGIHPDDRLRVVDQLKRHLTNLTDEFDLEYRLATQPGGWRWTHTRGRVIGRDESGRGKRIVGTHTDIERYKYIEEALRQRNDELATIIERFPDGIVYIGPNGRVQAVNPTFLTITGFTPENMVGLTEQEMDERLAAQGDGDSHTTSCVRCPFTCSAHPSTNCRGCRIDLSRPQRRVLRRTRISLTPHSQAAIHHFSDITLVAELDRAKTDFMASAAQQLRAPLASMYGFSELLAGEEFDVDTQRDLIETIYKQTQTLVNLVNELLDLKRLSNDWETHAAFELLDIGRLVEEIVSGCRAQYGLSPFLLQCPPSSKASARILGNPKSLGQALRNILDNAVRFSPSASPIGVRVDIESDMEQHETVRLRISDHGSGMSAEEIEHAFDPFYRARGGLENDGLGLGLTKVKEIIDLHDGMIDISSTLGVGTTVQLRFPIAHVDRLFTD
jgi:signal transduction histidine kinase